MGKENLFKKIARDIGRTGAIDNAALTRTNKKYEKLMRSNLGYDQILMDWYAKQLRDESAKLWARNEPKTNASNNGLRGVKRDNKFKTVYETGTSGGGDDAADRTAAENLLTGTNYTEEERILNPKLNPVYGYQDGRVGRLYGTNVVTLNPRVKNMMTYALGDSECDQLLGRYGFADWSAIRPVRNRIKSFDKWNDPFNFVQELDLIKKRLAALKGAAEGAPNALQDIGFIENQYYGDLTADDIAKITDLDGHEKQLSDFGD